MATAEFYPRDFEGVWIPKEIYLNEDLNALDKIIFAEINSLDRHLSGGDYCYASNEYLAKFCGCGITKVSTTISRLIDLGYLKIVRMNGRKRWIKSVLKERLSNSERQTFKNCETDFQTMNESNISNNTNDKYTNKDNIECHSLQNDTSVFPKELEDRAGRWSWKSDKEYLDYIEKVLPKFIREIAKELCEGDENAYSIFLRIITTYYKMYRHYNGKYHPWYKKETIKEVLVEIYDFFGHITVSEVKEFMEQFFSHEKLRCKPMKVFSSHGMLEILQNELDQDWTDAFM